MSSERGKEEEGGVEKGKSRKLEEGVVGRTGKGMRLVHLGDVPDGKGKIDS